MKKTKLCLIVGLAAMAIMIVPNNAKAFNFFKTDKYRITEMQGEWAPEKILTNLDTNDYTAQNVLSNISLRYKADVTVKAYNEKDEELTGKEILGTGSTIKTIPADDRYQSDILNVVLYGDVNGDGKINSTDALLIIKNKTGKVKILDPYCLEAGRVSDATRKKYGTPSATDALTIIKSKTGASKISQYNKYNESKTVESDYEVIPEDEFKKYLTPVTITKDNWKEYIKLEDYIEESKNEFGEITYTNKYTNFNFKENNMFGYIALRFNVTNEDRLYNKEKNEITTACSNGLITYTGSFKDKDDDPNINDWRFSIDDLECTQVAGTAYRINLPDDIWRKDSFGNWIRVEDNEYEYGYKDIYGVNVYAYKKDTYLDNLGYRERVLWENKTK